MTHPDARRAGSHARALAAVLLAALSLAAAPRAAPAQSLTVNGCDERLPGEVGVAAAQGTVGQFVSVPVTVHADTAINAFTLHVDVPPGVLTYVRTDPGDLIGTSDWLSGFFFAADDRVRIVGLMASGTSIPSGTSGTLAVLVFQVAAAGTGDFGTSNLQDDLASYESCEDLHGTTATEAWNWGRAKAAYR